jgi:hypothetical protein
MYNMTRFSNWRTRAFGGEIVDGKIWVVDSWLLVGGVARFVCMGGTGDVLVMIVGKEGFGANTVDEVPLAQTLTCAFQTFEL